MITHFVLVENLIVFVFFLIWVIIIIYAYSLSLAGLMGKEKIAASAEEQDDQNDEQHD